VELHSTWALEQAHTLFRGTTSEVCPWPSATLHKGAEEQETVEALLKLPALQHYTLPAQAIF